MTQKIYIGTKIIRAEPMTERMFMKTFKGEQEGAVRGDRPGYLVIYQDGYTSWSPKDTFDAAYREVSPAEYELMDRLWQELLASITEINTQEQGKLKQEVEDLKHDIEVFKEEKNERDLQIADLKSKLDNFTGGPAPTVAEEVAKVDPTTDPVVGMNISGAPPAEGQSEGSGVLERLNKIIAAEEKAVEEQGVDATAKEV